METKICTKCGQERNIEDFYWRNKSKGTRRSDCKYCHGKYVRENYQERKNEIQELKSICKCAKCGESRGYLLDYHHKDPSEKDFNISRLTSNNRKQELIDKEITKCVVLCANCHREFHYFENKNGITLDDYLP